MDRDATIVELQRRLAVAEATLQEKAGSEAALRESEERQAFLLALSDTLRPLGDPVQIQEAACRILGERLGANRAFYARVDAARNVGVVEHDYVRNGGPSAAGEYNLADFGPLIETLVAGRAFIADDVEATPLGAASQMPQYAPLTIRADVTMPLVKAGRLVASMTVHKSTPHHWTDHELSLIRETAERTWDAVERAHAERALRESEEKYRAVFDSITEGFSLLEIVFDEHGEACDLIIRDANPAQDRIDGVRALIGKRVSEILPDLEMKWIQRYAEIARTGTPAQFEDWSEANQRWYEVHASPVDAAGGALVAIVYDDITERRRAETALRESEERFALLFKVLPVGVAVVGPTGGLLLANDTMRRFLPIDLTPSAADRQRWTAVHPDGRAFLPQDFPMARALRGETVVPGIEMLYRQDDGRQIWVQVASVPMLNPAGAVTGAFNVVVEIDGLKRAEARQSVLLAELQHRVRNTLAMVRSIAKRTADGAVDVELLKGALEGRIDALARTQVVLTRAAGAGVDLGRLVHEEILAQTSAPERLTIGGAPVTLSPKAAELLTLTIHELTTNSTKYGALAGHGAIAVSWTVDSGPDDRDRLSLHWDETGVGPLPPKPLRRGFGTELIEERVPYELEGEGRIELGPDGVHARIVIPLVPGESILATDVPQSASSDRERER